MKIREEVLLDSEGRNRLYNIYSCNTCAIEYKKQKRIAEGSKYEHYCSKACGTVANVNNTKIKLLCAHCGNEFLRQKSKLRNSKHNVYFCSRICKDIGQSYIKSIQPNHYGTGESSYRDKALNNLANKCSCCGFNNFYALEVHHIDKNRNNNSLSNLAVLCANCHTLVHKEKIKLVNGEWVCL